MLPLFLPDLPDDPQGLAAPAPLAGLVPAVVEQRVAAAVEQPAAQPASAPATVIIPDEEISFDTYVAQVLEIIPDVLPAHVFSLIEQRHPTHKDNVVEAVLHLLMENPDYPKVDVKGKGKRKRDDSDDHQAQRAVRPKVDYGDKNRKADRGLHYASLTIEQLESDFLSVPTTYIRQVLKENNALYAPTYLVLRDQLRSNTCKKMVRLRSKGKGKRVQRHDSEFDREVQWVKEKLSEEETKRAAEAVEELKMQEEGGIECGCCFCEYPFDKMVQCPEAHLFCTSCMISYAETKLGEHDARIVCMDQSGCKLPFPESELRRFLTPKLLELYERVKQRKEIEAAGLEGLEECPFCEYKVVIENEQERLFRCENEACGAVTCRKCKKLDHLPKTCQEVEEDKKLDGRHAIEEAMTRALMRNCPKCQKAFVKEMGCNKMTCPNCGTLSCYICRKVITGYDHFNNPPPYTARPDSKKCPLWDTSVEGRHSDEVTAAAKKALEEYKRTHPELDDKDLRVDLPPPPPAAPGPSRAAPPPHVQVPAAPMALHHYQAVAGPVHAHPYRHGLPPHHRVQDWRHDVRVEARDGGVLPGAVQHHQVHHALGGPVFNVQVHINNNPPAHGHAQAGPAFAPPAAPPGIRLPYGQVAAVPRRRSARKRAAHR
ncbi:hypothetical protein C8Q74DRAFT_1211250 [Fomes fomentarius]|nr:hypothetical protein C8Q74DRAFT_1211250 [Fomes fomentarius]